MKFNKLYNLDSKNKKRCWEISVLENKDKTATILRKHGTCDGKIQETEYTVREGKNIGKSNETNPYSQAVIMAKAFYKKQIDSGYRENLEDCDAILPMLAHEYLSNSKHIPELCYIQPKLDGVRLIVGKSCKGEHVAFSRTGKPIIHMDHITEELYPLLRNGQYVDGEAFTFDHTFQEITGALRKTLDKSVESSKDMLKCIKLHVFDTFDLYDINASYTKRLDTIKQLFKNKLQNSVFVDTKIITKAQHKIDEYHDYYVGLGYEGLMLRDPESTYKINGRSQKLLKYKKFITNEYKIVGAKEANGRDKGTVIWECMHDCKIFQVRPIGTLKERKEMFDNKQKYINKFITVKYQNLTDSGLPRFGVGLAIRDYE